MNTFAGLLKKHKVIDRRTFYQLQAGGLFSHPHSPNLLVPNDQVGMSTPTQRKSKTSRHRFCNACGSNILRIGFKSVGGAGNLSNGANPTCIEPDH